jgi:hypothetical protein
MAPPVDSPQHFFKPNPPSTDTDSESGSESEDSNDEEDYQDALPQPFQKSFSIVSFKKSPLQHTLALARKLGEGTSGFNILPIFEQTVPATGQSQRHYDSIPFKTLKELKQACTMY